MTRITDLLGIKYPIFQGGMAWVADYHIASAVSEAGGLGIIGVGGADEVWLKDQIAKCREVTDKPFGVNLMLMNPRADAIAEVIAQEKVKVVTTGAGSPEKYMKMWKDAGIIVIPVIASVAYAKRMERCGADAVVAEGTESGGHIGEATTMVLVPQVADAVSIPVVAAGGIADGRGVAASFMLGAEAVQCGTVFCASDEVHIHQNYKDMVLKANDTSTKVTGRSTGHPVRQIRNRLTSKYLELEAQGAGLEELEKFTVGSLRRAVVDGDTKEGTFMAGQIAGMVNEQRPVKTIIEQMFVKADELVGRKLEV
ncbi:MAG: enoyl-[acyl-carrier-protein] reductase FabK [Saccharofermentans sp.]|jgi:enoyl-[acyl-carrier protein] reductase II|nr:enoyl-[acyl-carrier-protein] reductase FabK [Mageeibacillus sp.]MCI1264159.1 enoyl-[acyl-carrier-protein] reductase FabK [Saccharofermentans sp.]MCI1275265.1 enoyl-[acyl-carrier-protein] reductase FabK [Saccharofermentans sp.]MCI1768726.1 enoyl-[acyl-carrier-protein] reductase FabK [Mageeibacillus sp.]